MKAVYPPCDLIRQARSMRGSFEAAFKRVLSRGIFVSGPEMRRFESRFARQMGARWAVGTSSGTDALRLALLGCGVGPGDEVIIPAMTFVGTAEAVVQTGARPVLADIDPETYCIDPRQVESAVSKRTRAIMPVHLYGHPADMLAIGRIVRRYPRLTIVEDCAQAHGASIKSKKVGSFGRMSGYSFYPTKNLGAYGDGGMVAGLRASDAGKIRALTNHGGFVRDEHKEIGYTARLDELQAALLNIKLGYLNKWNRKKRVLAGVYGRYLGDLPVGRPVERAAVRHVYHQYVITCPERDRVAYRLAQSGVGCLVHYSKPLHLLPSLRFLGYRRGRFPVAERLANHCLSLPIYPELTERDVKEISRRLKRAFR